MKTALVLTGLFLLLIANILMMMRSSYGWGPREAFQNVTTTSANSVDALVEKAVASESAMNSANSTSTADMAMNAAPMNTKYMTNSPSMQDMASQNIQSMGAKMPNATSTAANAEGMAYPNSTVKEGFASFFLENAGGAKEKYESIGAYDGVTLPTGNNVSQWRYTAPNEKLLGDEFVPGPDSLFMFKNNQCKPECCGASFSCGGGCVCTTPQQRQYLAGRGGNRTQPEDSA